MSQRNHRAFERLKREVRRLIANTPGALKEVSGGVRRISKFEKVAVRIGSFGHGRTQDKVPRATTGLIDSTLMRSSSCPIRSSSMIGSASCTSSS